jgi:hypothetical protein
MIGQESAACRGVARRSKTGGHSSPPKADEGPNPEQGKGPVCSPSVKNPKGGADGRRVVGKPNPDVDLFEQVLMPIFDPGFSEASFGFRPGRSAHDAVYRVRDFIKGSKIRWSDKAFAEFKRRVRKLGRLHGVPILQTGRIPARMDGLLRNIGILSSDSGNRPLASQVLCEAMALVSHKSSRVGEARHKPSDSNIFRLES